MLVTRTPSPPALQPCFNPRWRRWNRVPVRVSPRSRWPCAASCPCARRSPTNYALVIGLVVAPVGLWDDPGGAPRPTPTWRKRGTRVTDLSLGQQIAASRGRGRGRMRGCRPVSGRGRSTARRSPGSCCSIAPTLPVLDAVAHLCGLQAQEPQEPFVGLWSRLRAFDPAALSDLLVGRRRGAHPPHAPHRPPRDRRGRAGLAVAPRRHAAPTRTGDLPSRARRGGSRRARGGGPGGDGRRRARARWASSRRALADRWPAPGPRALGEMVIAALVPMAQLPPRGLWRTNGGAQHLLLSSWLGREIDPPPRTAPTRWARRWCGATSPRSARRPRRTCAPGAASPGCRAAVAAVRDELVSLPRRARPGAAGPPRRAAPRPRTPRPGAVPARVRQRDPRLRRPQPDRRRRPPRACRSRASAPCWSTAGSRGPGRVEADTVVVTPLRALLPGRPRRRRRGGAGAGVVPLRRRAPPRPGSGFLKVLAGDVEWGRSRS